MTANATKRAQALADARALLDLIEANPALPFTGIRIAEFPAGDDQQERDAVDTVAAVLGTNPIPGARGHYRAEKRIGSSEYEVVAIPKASMDAWRTIVAPYSSEVAA